MACDACVACSCRRAREDALERVAARGRELEALQQRAHEALERADAANKRELEQADQCLLSIHVRSLARSCTANHMIPSYLTCARVAALLLAAVIYHLQHR